MILLRRCLFYVLTLIAILISNAALAMAFEGPLLRWLLIAGLAAGVGGFVAWLMALKIATWAKLVEPMAQVPELAKEYELEERVAALAGKLALSQVPQLGIYESEEVNAFAVARDRNSALIAVSSALLRQLSSEQVEAVIAQRLAFIANGDAATLPLIFGQIYAFTLFPARMLALLLGTALRTAEEETPSDPVETFMIALLSLVFTPLAAVLAWLFLRNAQRRADAVAARVMGPAQIEAMVQQLAKNANRNEARDKFTVPMKVYTGFWHWNR